MEPAWDHEALKAWFLARPGEDVAETDLLRTFFPDDEPFALGVGLELFHKHFLLYRRLWLFDDELRTSTGQRLWIRGIRSTLLEPPEAGLCRWLNPDAGEFCREPSENERGELCPRHRTLAPETGGMKSYYFDWKNLEAMTEDGVKKMVEGFFRWMGNQGDRAQALETLGLPADAESQVIKARWRTLSLEHHPDRGGDSKRFQELSAAWAVLKFLDS